MWRNSQPEHLQLEEFNTKNKNKNKKIHNWITRNWNLPSWNQVNGFLIHELVFRFWPDKIFIKRKKKKANQLQRREIWGVFQIHTVKRSVSLRRVMWRFCFGLIAGQFDFVFGKIAPPFSPIRFLFVPVSAMKIPDFRSFLPPLYQFNGLVAHLGYCSPVLKSGPSWPTFIGAQLFRKDRTQEFDFIENLVSFIFFMGKTSKL